MRILVLLLASGCSSLFGLDQPRRLDASPDSVLDDSGIDTTMTDAMTDAAANCPTGYMALGGSRYRMIATTMLTWAQAANACAADSVSTTKFTHLAVIGSEAERSNLTAFNNVNNGLYWLGLSDLLIEGTFLWVTNENTNNYPPQTGTPWGVGQPSGSATDDCVTSTATTEFQDVTCGVILPALCECDDFANDSTRY